MKSLEMISEKIIENIIRGRYDKRRLSTRNKTPPEDEPKVNIAKRE